MQTNIQAHLEDLDRWHFKIFLEKIQHGDYSIQDYTPNKDRLLRAALYHDNTTVANLILDHFEVPGDLNLRQRLAMYQLLKES